MQDVGGETLPPVVKVVVTFCNFKVPLNYFNYWNKNNKMALQEMTANHFGTNYLRKLAPALPINHREISSHPPK